MHTFEKVMKMNLKKSCKLIFKIGNFLNCPSSPIPTNRAKIAQNWKFIFSKLILERQVNNFYYIRNTVWQLSFLVAFYLASNSALLSSLKNFIVVNKEMVWRLKKYSLSQGNFTETVPLKRCICEWGQNLEQWRTLLYWHCLFKWGACVSKDKTWKNKEYC